MTPNDFCYWLQGYFELAEENNLTSEQVATIKEHLNLVFAKITSEADEEKSISKEDLEKILKKSKVKPIKWRPSTHDRRYC